MARSVKLILAKMHQLNGEVLTVQELARRLGASPSAIKYIFSHDLAEDFEYVVVGKVAVVGRRGAVDHWLNSLLGMAERILSNVTRSCKSRCCSVSLARLTKLIVNSPVILELKRAGVPPLSTAPGISFVRALLERRYSVIPLREDNGKPVDYRVTVCR
ncbi:MAG: hypothetical protein QXQ91_02665 [Nanopusillaceae archaeon]